MKAQAFNNAVVSLVSAYAEALGEQTQLADQLQHALAQAAKLQDGPAAVLKTARSVVAVIERCKLEDDKPLPPALLDALRGLVVAVHAVDRGAT